jgi:hypothetical protein
MNATGGGFSERQRAAPSECRGRAYQVYSRVGIGALDTATLGMAEDRINATDTWFLLLKAFHDESRTMMRMDLDLAAMQMPSSFCSDISMVDTRTNRSKWP